jgi:hypothetical protein
MGSPKKCCVLGAHVKFCRFVECVFGFIEKIVDISQLLHCIRL